MPLCVVHADKWYTLLCSVYHQTRHSHLESMYVYPVLCVWLEKYDKFVIMYRYLLVKALCMIGTDIIDLLLRTRVL